jgi:glycosyltransferase involved in cell wall biosynthesis
MKLVIEESPKTVTVITPTIGSEKLLDAITSVATQTYNCKHLIVIDGSDFVAEVLKIIDITKIMDPQPNIQVIVSPENTGKFGDQSFYGHRIYAAYPHLINSDYMLFLDEDNWYEQDHVATLIETIEKKNLDFSYSLRKIFSPEKKYLCDDNCESLGKWPIFMSRRSPHGEQFLIDTSSFCFKREFIQKTCHFWHHGWGGDRHFLYAVKNHAKYETNGKHTLCYRLDGNPNSVTKEFFDVGNKTQDQYYGGKFPWLKT